MWIVRLPLRRPYTFAVLALVLLILGPLVALTTPTDIFPNINIPVVAMVWQYTGLSPEQMANRIVVLSERSRRRPTAMPTRPRSPAAWPRPRASTSRA